MTPHILESGFCVLCNQATQNAHATCPVNFAFKRWLATPANPGSQLTIGDVTTKNEKIIARSAFAAGYRSYR